MIPPETEIIRQASKSKVLETVVKQLRSPMLFLVVMSLIILFGAHWWTSSLDVISRTISFWLWFAVTTGITIYGIYILIVDARIRIATQTIE